jgi:hypothetical protein
VVSFIPKPESIGRGEQMATFVLWLSRIFSRKPAPAKHRFYWHRVKFDGLKTHLLVDRENGKVLAEVWKRCNSTWCTPCGDYVDLGSALVATMNNCVDIELLELERMAILQ